MHRKLRSSTTKDQKNKQLSITNSGIKYLPLLCIQRTLLSMNMYCSLYITF
jgi:hypothetical protein